MIAITESKITILDPTITIKGSIITITNLTITNRDPDIIYFEVRDSYLEVHVKNTDPVFEKNNYHVLFELPYIRDYCMIKKSYGGFTEIDISCTGFDSNTIANFGFLEMFQTPITLTIYIACE